MSSPRRRALRTFVFRQKETRVGRCNGSSASRRAIERQSQTDPSTQHRYVARRSDGDAGRGGLRCSGQAPAALGTFGLFRIKGAAARNRRRRADSAVDSVSACARLHTGLAFKRALERHGGSTAGTSVEAGARRVQAKITIVDIIASMAATSATQAGQPP